MPEITFLSLTAAIRYEVIYKFFKVRIANQVINGKGCRRRNDKIFECYRIYDFVTHDLRFPLSSTNLLSDFANRSGQVRQI